MKKEKDLMHVRERHTRFGELSFELYCSGKDPVTRKNKVYVKTYKVPSGLTKKEIAEYRLKVQLEWKEQVKGLSNGTLFKPSKILFKDFADEFAENILKQNEQAYNYYRKVKDVVTVLNERLGNYYLHELNQKIIDDFILWLGQRKYTKTTIVVRKSLISSAYIENFQSLEDDNR